MGTLRRATADDAEQLTRLRGQMHLDMGAGALPEAWRLACTEAFRRRLAAPDFVAFGVEDDGRLVSCGAGWVEEHLPSPGQYDGRRGHIASMSTEPQLRRRGYARQVFGALMGWFDEAGIGRVDLRATEDGRGLYTSFGFRVLGGATMAWTAPGVAPGMPGR
ncbi:MAG: GNAT family N-acetyltransferase [Mycobacteriales bacterium]